MGIERIDNEPEDIRHPDKIDEFEEFRKEGEYKLHMVWGKEIQFILSIISNEELLRARRIMETVSDNWMAVKSDGRKFHDEFWEATKLSGCALTSLIEAVDEEMFRRKQNEIKAKT